MRVFSGLLPAAIQIAARVPSVADFQVPLTYPTQALARLGSSNGAKAAAMMNDWQASSGLSLWEAELMEVSPRQPARRNRSAARATARCRRAASLAVRLAAARRLATAHWRTDLASARSGSRLTTACSCSAAEAVRLRPRQAPKTEDVLRVEGWILGQRRES